MVSAEAPYVQAEHGRCAMIFAARKYELEVSHRQQKVGEACHAFELLLEEAWLIFGSHSDTDSQFACMALILSQLAAFPYMSFL